MFRYYFGVGWGGVACRVSFYCRVLGRSHRSNMLTVAATAVVKYWSVTVLDRRLNVAVTGLPMRGIGI